MTGPAHSAPVDLEAFRRAMREADVEDAVDAILATFVTTLPAHLDTLAAAVRGNDGVGVQRAAHGFKAAAAAISAATLATLLATLETAARDGDPASVPPAFERVLHEANAVLDQLRAAATS